MNIHTLRIEALLVSASRMRDVTFGNKPKSYEERNAELVPDYEQVGIDAVEGDSWSTI